MACLALKLSLVGGQNGESNAKMNLKGKNWAVSWPQNFYPVLSDQYPFLATLTVITGVVLSVLMILHIY